MDDEDGGPERLGREEMMQQWYASYRYSEIENLHISNALADYTTSFREIDDTIAAMKAVYVDEGRKMAAAKREAGALLCQPKERSYFTRLHAMTREQQDLITSIWRHQQQRKDIKKAVLAMEEGYVPGTLHWPVEAVAILAQINARYDAAWKAAVAAVEERLKAKALLDSTWEDECQRRVSTRRWLEGMRRGAAA